MFDTLVSIPYSPAVAPFFDDMPLPKKQWHKVYHDGGHFIATKVVVGTYYKPNERDRKSKAMDLLFNNLYFNALNAGLKGCDLKAYIMDGILKLFPTAIDLGGYIDKRMERSIKNLHTRKKRFRRKAYLNSWTHFITITYADSKHDAITFRKKLRRCLSNLHSRRGWRYMGVFEHAPETGRLHFHALVYVPDGEMIGRLKKVEDYDKHKSCMQITHSNSFFAENFGRNDFKELNQKELFYGNTISYLLKYIGKTNERIVYSRGIPSAYFMQIDETDIAAEMLDDYVPKYIIFDESIQWRKELFKKRQSKQMSIVDFLCNPTHRLAS